MTDEVGVVTGDLTVATEVRGDQATITVQYTGAEEWYTVTGSPLTVVGCDGPWVHAAVVRAVAAGLPEGLAEMEAE
ncbi:hypothetical protein Ssi03_77110 [Sphaerisporangium siamense]|uniref:Uncharacterized protein n=1 Tax=Sphaerisporangium siamense TaxID=795645 RepID=A0A7W7D901_9ACTN|nr:hypothetical protein [Sphaerisporangium siamense]MBB4702271.1 hypothetical protein [Sphaerisporangium siamense]GII89721.1 hypothetical protein Ssi03_77110 [Sphaerisporangium siamense]